MKKKADMPVYGWIFVIIVGAVILLLALIFASRLLGIERSKSSAELLRKFDILLDPFSSIGGIAEVSMAKEIKMPTKVEIRIECSNSEEEPELGMHTLIFGAELLKKKELQRYKIYDKYIFSQNMSGKNFYVFSKPFELAFRVDDLIYVFNQSYCFVKSLPEEIEEELNMINMSVIKASDNKCGNAINVCFSTDSCDGDCDICVRCGNGIAKCNYGDVDGKDFVTHALIYAAVFSSDENYKCNFERLTKRLSFVADIYSKKAVALVGRGCDIKNIKSRINELKREAEKEIMLIDMGDLFRISEELAEQNSMLSCQVF